MTNIIPKLSVIIPAFNVEAFIEGALDSLKSQTFTDFEAIVIDDSSTDSTKKLAEKYGIKDARIKVVTNARKKGVSGARNTGIWLARGEWIAFLDADDLLHSDSLKARIDAAKADSTTQFISGDFIPFSEAPPMDGNRHSLTNQDWRIAFGAAVSEKRTTEIYQPIIYFLKSVLVNTNTVLIKTSILKSLNGFDEELSSVEDDHLWMRVAASVNKLTFTPFSVAYYRQREGSLTRSNFSIHHSAPKAYRKLIKDPLLSGYEYRLKENVKEFIHNNTFYYRKNGKFFKAFQSAVDGIASDPGNKISWRNLAACICLR